MALLERGKQIRVVLDTDAANEIDDQFAIVWALLSPDQVKLEAVHAAPFSHGHYLAVIAEAASMRGGERTRFEKLAEQVGPEGRRSLLDRKPPSNGEHLSRIEIERVVDAVAPHSAVAISAGSDRFMTGPDVPVDSEAARRLIELVHASDEPLYVGIMGAPTNVASALLLDPTIAEKLVVVFVGGYPTATPHALDSFNMVQDRHATNVLFERATHLVYQPGQQVAEVLGFSLNDSETWLKGSGSVGDLLHDLYVANPIDRDVNRVGRTWVMWDLITPAWLIDAGLAPTVEVSRARINDRHLWEAADGQMHECYHVERNDLFADFLDKVRDHDRVAGTG